MALIPKEPVLPKKEQLNIRLDPDVIVKLETYCTFIESTQNYVIQQLLLYTFRKDKEFQRYLENHGTTRRENRSKVGTKLGSSNTQIPTSEG
jgi:hypothetical protein